MSLLAPLPANATAEERQKQVQTLLAFYNYAKKFPDFDPSFNWTSIGDPDHKIEVRENGIVVSAIVTVIISSLIVIGRFIIRARRKAWGLDDWFMLVAWILTIAFSILQILFVTKSWIGHHIYDIPYWRLQLLVQITHWDLIIYIIAMQCLRTSVFLHLRRITPRSMRVTHHIIIWTLVFQTIMSIVAFLLNFLACKNPATIWSLDTRLRDDRCMDWKKLILGIGVTFTVADFWTLCVPMRIIWKLKLKTRSVLAACFCFVLAGFAQATAFARLFYVYPSYNSFDSTWNGNGSILWIQYETTIGLIAASLPMYNILLIDTFPRWWNNALLHPKWGSRLQSWTGQVPGDGSSISDTIEFKKRYLEPPMPQLVPHHYASKYSSSRAICAVSVSNNSESYASGKAKDEEFVTGHEFFTDDESEEISQTSSPRRTKMKHPFGKSIVSSSSSTTSSHPTVPVPAFSLDTNNPSRIDRERAVRSFQSNRSAIHTYSLSSQHNINPAVEEEAEEPFSLFPKKPKSPAPPQSTQNFSNPALKNLSHLKRESANADATSVRSHDSGLSQGTEASLWVLHNPEAQPKE